MGVKIIDNDDDVRGIIIDPKTGEVTGKLLAGDKIIRGTSSEYLMKTQEWKIDNYFKGHAGELNKLMKDLSTQEKAFLFSVVPYVSYEDCHLQYSNGNDLGTEDLVRITGMGRRNVYLVIKDLISKDIIYRGKNSKNRQFFVNPWLFCKGNRINKVLKTMFKNYRIRVHGGIQWKNL